MFSAYVVRVAHNWCYHEAGSNGWRNWCKRYPGESTSTVTTRFVHIYVIIGVYLHLGVTCLFRVLQFHF